VGTPNEWQTYRHPETSSRVAINVEWREIFEGDATFQILCQRTGISRRRFLDLLSDG